jgi:transcriptional regulator with XRE-family HTH domain
MEAVMNDLSRKFGENVRALRNEKKWSQTRLAERSGLHWSYISRVERGVCMPRLTNVEKIARALRVQPSRLLQ